MKRPSRVNATVLRKAKQIVKKAVPAWTSTDQSLPVFSLWYPQHGEGIPIKRVIRVLEADDQYIKGFQIRNEFDDEAGRFRKFDRSKISGLNFLRLPPKT